MMIINAAKSFDISATSLGSIIIILSVQQDYLQICIYLNFQILQRNRPFHVQCKHYRSPDINDSSEVRRREERYEMSSSRYFQRDLLISDTRVSGVCIIAARTTSLN